MSEGLLLPVASMRTPGARPPEAGRIGALDQLLIAAGAVASGLCTLGIFQLEPTVSGSGRAWMAIYTVLSWGSVVVAVHLLRSSIRRDLPRLALAVVIVGPVLLFVANYTTCDGICRPGDAVSMSKDLVTLLVEEGSSRFRPLFIFTLVPVIGSWLVLVRQPMVAVSRPARTGADLTLVAAVVAVADLAALSTAKRLATPGGTVAGITLIGVSVALAWVGYGGRPRLSVAMRTLQVVAAPCAVAAVGWAELIRAWSGTPTVIHEWQAVTIVTLLMLPALAAFVAAVHDHLLVADRRSLRRIANCELEPRAIRDVLRSVIGDPELELTYPGAEPGSFIDGDGRAIDLAAVPPARQYRVANHTGLVAVVVWGPNGTGASRRSVALVGIAALALERALLRARVLSERELADLGRRVLEEGDRVRRRIERQLHDSVQAPLVVALARLRAAAAPGGPGAPDLNERVIEDVEQALGLLRTICRDLLPHTLTVGGLTAAVEQLAARLPIPVERSVVVGRFDPVIELQAFMVVSEALTNVVKYAEASRAELSVAVDESGTMRIEVRDDGVGGAVPEPGGGLHGTMVGVAALRGTFRLDSEPGRGTTIRVTLPHVATVDDPPRPR